MLFACQGSATNPAAANPTYQQNLVAYANAGGRIFATHYSYVWLDDTTVFADTANWSLNLKDESISNNPINATIDQSYLEGQTLAQWLYYIQASTTLGQIPLSATKKDQTGVNPPTQSWATLDSTADGDPVMQFTFDTPLGLPGTPSVGINYTNSTNTFQQGDLSDTVIINATNTSNTPAGAGLTLAIKLPGGLTLVSLKDVGNTGWVCNQTTLTCVEPAGLAPNASDSVALTFSISPTVQVGQVSITAALSGGGLSNTSQCGRVLFNEYHVETSSTGKKIFPQECETGAMTPQEKFLEFSLYNLSSFLAPSTTDSFIIQGPVTINWPPPAAIPYGTALSNIQLDATAADNANAPGTAIPGSFVFTPPAGTVLNAGGNTLSVAFTPTDTTDYASAMKRVPLEIDPDGTTTTLMDVVSPIYYGQIIADVAIESTSSQGPAPLDGGTIVFYINGAPSCVLPAVSPVQGICPPSTGANENAGTYAIYSAYVPIPGDGNFSPSVSKTYSVVVQPDPTTTTLLPAGTSPPGLPVTFTATVGDIYYSPVTGYVTFSDGNTPLATVAVSASQTAAYTTATLPIGVHSIQACFVASQNFKASCSSPMLETISLPGTVNPTTTILTSSLNPSVVGESVTFTATTATTGAFISTPAGNVNFYDSISGSPVLLGPGILNNGVATLTTSTLAAGLHPITAAYTGNATTAPSTSAILAQQVNTGIASAGTGFLMSVSPTAFSVAVGTSATVGVTILDLNSFNMPVSLSCSGLPAEATCTFTQPTIAAPGGSTPLTITVAAPHACGTSTPYFVADGRHTGLPILAAAVLLFFARRRRMLKGLLLAAVICIVPAISGCGNCTDLGVRPGTYTFTVVGTAGGATPVTVAAPTTGSSSVASTTMQTQTMTMTVTI